MSQHEFDQFLSLLSGLLRLNPSQREAIASELRDHLEERLTDLLAQGVPRHKAIETALEEFGDTTGLASEFVQIFRKQRRRWVMRMTLSTAAGLAVLAMLTTAFWPQGRPGSLDHLVAQDAAAASEGPQLAATRADVDKMAEAALRQRLDIDLREQPLIEALELITGQVRLQFYVKQRFLEDLGMSGDETVTLSLKQVSAEMALDLILEQLQLTYIIRDGIILVTTEEDVENVAEIRVYNCRDLLDVNHAGGSVSAIGEQVDETGGDFLQPIEAAAPAKKTNTNKRKNRPKSNPDGKAAPAKQSNVAVVPRHVLAQFGGGGGVGGAVGGGHGEISGMGGLGGVRRAPVSRADQLIDIITGTVAPDTWDELGGYGSIAEFDGMIVIRQNPQIHREVERVLEMLREAAKEQAWSGPSSTRMPFGGGGLGGGGGFF